MGVGEEEGDSDCRKPMGDARKGWTAAEEEELLRLLSEFTVNRVVNRGRKGKSKYTPMADRLNKTFHMKNQIRYPKRTWENLRVKANNLRAKYENIKRRVVDERRHLDKDRAIELWPHFELCHTVFAEKSHAARDEDENAHSTDDEHENSRNVSAGDDSRLARENHASNHLQNSNRSPGADALVEMIRALQKNVEDGRMESLRQREVRDRTFLTEIEKLRSETRNFLDSELRRLRHEQTQKIAELEGRLTHLIESSTR